MRTKKQQIQQIKELLSANPPNIENLLFWATVKNGRYKKLYEKINREMGISEEMKKYFRPFKEKK